MNKADADIYYQRAASMLTGVVAAFSQYSRRKSIFAVAGEPKIRFSRDRWLYEYGVRNVDCVIAQNEAQQQVVRRKFNRDAILIPNCYQSAEFGEEVPHGGVLWAAMIRKVKRPDLFLDLVESLPGVQFTMVGGRSGEEGALYEVIEKRAREIKNLNFTGFVPYASVHEYFGAADLFVNTSDSEGFPNTFLQSWACGVPTISFIDCGARWNGQPVGRIVSSIDGMRESIRRLLIDDQDRLRVGAECRQYVQANHSTNTVLDRFEEVLSCLLQPDDI